MVTSTLLIYKTIVLSILIFCLRFNLLWPPPYSSLPLTRDAARWFSLDESFHKTLQDAYETIQYLYAMQSGNAIVQPVTEKSKPIMETTCYCGYCNPKLILHNNNNTQSGNTITWIESVYDNSEMFYLFSAHYDVRKNSLYPDTTVSIQVLASAFDFRLGNESATHYCHFANDDTEILFTVEAHIRMIWQRGWDPRYTFYNPYLITCPIPEHYLNNFLSLNKNFVTVSMKKCPAVNELHFIEIVEQKLTEIIFKKNFNDFKMAPIKIAVCVKGMDFLKGELSNQKLIEWIELQYSLGADSITIYTYYVPPSINEIFRIYATQGRFKMFEIELPGLSPNEKYIRNEYIKRNRQQKRRHELIPYNDCFYRYIHSHDYVLIVDTDEIIVPLKAASWNKMLEELIIEHNKKSTKFQISALSVQNVFKFNGMETGGSIFDERYRSSKIQDRGLYGKSFINTKSIATVFNHFALHRLHSNVMRTIYVDENTAIKLHLKTDCPTELKSNCDELRNTMILDTSLDPYKIKVNRNTKVVMRKLNKIINNLLE